MSKQTIEIERIDGWEVSTVQQHNFMGFEDTGQGTCGVLVHYRKIPPRKVPLDAGDFTVFKSVLRNRTGERHGVVSVESDRVWLGKGTYCTFGAMQASGYDVSHDGERTWQRCEKDAP